ncbi:hypothetical protein [Leucobacter komagatae]|uniref:hypothetical protein n=1 Tax=Leucobacter komagatae TaxID=55969 RepID=UPI00114EED92|nr:hypothetical protein [Leucobacter komagatae]
MFWADTSTGIRIPFSVKPERKANTSIIFLFTSIRSKPHWVDFDGAQGDALSTNRGRIVFLHDEFATNFTYHLALEGDSRLLAATARFIEAYVAEEGYAWDQVILAGMSKGASSALAVSARIPQCVLILVSPQLAVGAYLTENRPNILRTIAGTDAPGASSAVDSIFWDSFAAVPARHGITRCTILTSQNDPHCTEGLKQLAEALDIGDKLEIHVDTGENTGSHIDTVHFHASAFAALLSASTSLAPLKLINGF